VELTGEAYFEVKKGDTPFIVKTPEAQITVTGTSFNVNAYQDSKMFQTTLVEGSVQINMSDKPDTYTLRPGNNFTLSKNSDEISIQKVNTDRYTSWMRGELIFRNQPLDDIFTSLKRWYDFEIEYNSPAIRTMRFSGSVEKKRPLDYFLNQIQTVTEIRYKAEGEKIILY
jgi:ferric-dicitrate binding protein FerR (iron transport regulator)